MKRPRALFFDVDFTLIYPGPTFQGEGYGAFARRHGLEVDVSAFSRAVAEATGWLDGPQDLRYDPAVFVTYTRRILEGMGGRGERLDACAREIYEEWAACRHFELYDEVPPVLADLVRSGIRIGLISNSHRSLASFQSHFDLHGLIACAVSSSDHGFLKPHPSIFRAALEAAGVGAGDAMMVGDHVEHDIEGALGAGLGAALLHRGDERHPRAGELEIRGVPVVRSLAELRELVLGW